MRKITTITTIFTFVILGLWFLQSNLSQTAQAAPFAPNTISATSIWQTEIVDSQTSYHSSLGIDSNDNLHMSYSHWLGGNVRYAYWNGSSWLTETIDSVGKDENIVTSLAVDSNDHPHISYDYGEESLKYAYWDGANWQIEVVDALGQTGRDNSIALDGGDNPHISYVKVESIGDSDRYLRYARWNGASWQIQDVDSTSDAFEDTSIAIDSKGYPHIAYRLWIDNDNGALKYARWNGTQWQIEVVDNTGSTGFDTSLALDSNDNPHITYGTLPDGTLNGELKYAYWDGSQWQKETVDSEDRVGSNSSLALDSNDKAYISYSEEVTGSLKFAFQNESGWQIDVVDPDPSFGYWYTSLQLDSHEQPVFSYFCLCQAGDHGLSIARWLGETDSKVISVGGGVFTPTSGLTFTFPSGAFSEPVTVTYSTIPSVASDMIDVGIFYELTAVYVSNGQPALLASGKTFTTVVKYNEANLPANVKEDSLSLFYQADNGAAQRPVLVATWEPASSNSVDTAKNEITAVDSHLGTWAVFADRAEYEVFLPVVIKP